MEASVDWGPATVRVGGQLLSHLTSPQIRLADVGVRRFRRILGLVGGVGVWRCVRQQE